jgi:hypothetical protein
MARRMGSLRVSHMGKPDMLFSYPSPEAEARGLEDGSACVVRDLRHTTYVLYVGGGGEGMSFRLPAEDSQTSSLQGTVVYNFHVPYPHLLPSHLPSSHRPLTP